MMMKESRDIDDILTLKLAIEPTEATRQSLNELSGLTDEILETIVKASEAFNSTLDQRRELQQTLSSIDADGYQERARQELEDVRLTAKETLDAVATTSLSRADTMPDMEIDTNRQAADISREDVISRVQAYESLHARGLPRDIEQVDSVASRGGIAEAFPDTVSSENGGLVDQLGVVASRMGQSILDSVRGSEGVPGFADTLENMPESAIERLTQAMQETAESTKKLADRSDEEELKERGLGAPRVPTEQAGDRPQRQRTAKPSKPPKVAQTPEISDVDRRFTAGQQIEELLGVKGRNSAVGRLQTQGNRISQWGERLSQINTTLNAPQDVLLDESGAPIMGEGGNIALDSEGNPVLDENGNFVVDAAKSAALVNAGSRAAGATGLGKVGSRVSQFGKGVTSVASRFAVPLAIGAGAYMAIDRGVEAIYDTSQGGYAQGETGWDAFTTGFQDNLSDTARGWNPFTPESRDELRKFRENAVNNMLGIAPDDERFDSLIDTQKEAGRRGLRPDQALQLYGQEIVRNEDFDINEALDDLAEGAKEAGVSLQNFANAAVVVADNMLDKFDISDPDRVNELVEMLNEGVFDAEEGFLGTLDDREKTSLVSGLTDYSDQRGQSLYRLLLRDEAALARMEDDGIDTRDVDAVLEWAWGGGLSVEELNDAIVGVATQHMPEGLDQTRTKEYIKGSIGVSVPSGRIEDIPEYEGVGSDFGSWTEVTTDDGTRVSSDKGYGGSVDINISLDPGLVADVSHTQEVDNVSSGNTEYEDRSQTGRTGITHFADDVRKIFG